MSTWDAGDMNTMNATLLGLAEWYNQTLLSASLDWIAPLPLKIHKFIQQTIEV